MNILQGKHKAILTCWKKITKIVIGGTISIIFLIQIISGCSSMGSDLEDKRIKKYSTSNNYDVKNEKFVNRKSGIIEKMTKENMSVSVILDFLKKRKGSAPDRLLPQLKPNMENFLKPSKDLKTIWFGHSSFLLNMDWIIILVDPVFSGAAAPVKFLVRRFQAPALSLEELPEIDYVLISHDHYDHLDMDSIKFFRDKNTQFITPLGVGAHLEGWGIEPKRIIEKDWWEETSLEKIKFIATPAQHFSGRGLFDRNCTLWASWVIQSENNNIYFSGDSGYDIHFKNIGAKYGPFDVAFLESGQYNKNWKQVHMLPTQAAQAYRDLKAKKYFPVHWGMFVLSTHTWYDPIKQLFKISKQHGLNLIVPKLGQIVNLSKDFNNEYWWESRTVILQQRERKQFVSLHE